MGNSVDYGGREQRFIPQGHSVHAKCPGCGLDKVYAKWAWCRASRPTCPACGLIMEPSKRAQELDTGLSTAAPPQNKRRCKQCRAFLRSGNETLLCALCHQKGRKPCS